MSHSQFDDTLGLSDPSEIERTGLRRVKVGGPLTLDADRRYRPPFAVHFAIIQSLAGDDHATRERANRVSDVAIVREKNAVRWEKDIEIDSGLFRSADARGIGMAILEKDGEFSYETITWCDHITLNLEEPAPAPVAAAGSGSGAPG